MSHIIILSRPFEQAAGHLFPFFFFFSECLDPDDPEGKLITSTSEPASPSPSRKLRAVSNTALGFVMLNAKDVKLRSVPTESQTPSTDLFGYLRLTIQRSLLQKTNNEIFEYVCVI
jgi:hypothetical protein